MVYGHCLTYDLCCVVIKVYCWYRLPAHFVVAKDHNICWITKKLLATEAPQFIVATIRSILMVIDRWRLMQFVVTKCQNNWEPLVLTIPGRLWITWIYTGQWGQGITNCKYNAYSNMTFQMLWPLATTNCRGRI